MEEISLSIAFGDSLEEETVACISEYAELGLDAMFDSDGEYVLKQYPTAGTKLYLGEIDFFKCFYPLSFQ